MSDGLLLVAKPKGITSHDVVDRVRRSLGIRKVGHAGTLDPMATGLLVVGVGRATRLLRFLGDLEKEYEGTARLGEETDTLDADGAVVASAQVDVTEADVRAAMQALVGETLQRPPAFSAVKVGGRRMYAAARSGDPIEAEARAIRVDAFDLLGFDGLDAEFRVVCSSGTYVRSLVADVGSKLGCGAHLTRLVRTRIGLFKLDAAGPPDDPPPLLPIERAVAHLPRRDAEHEDEARAASHGRCLGPADLDGPYALYDVAGKLVGIFRDTGTKSCPQVILATGA